MNALWLCEGKTYTAIELVEFFLKFNENWWTDKTNELYGWRDAAHDLLLYFLEHDDEPEEDIGWRMIYVLGKFQNECLPHFERFDLPEPIIVQ